MSAQPTDPTPVSSTPATAAKPPWRVWVAARNARRAHQAAQWLQAQASLEVAGEVTHTDALLDGLRASKRERVAVVLDELLGDGHGLGALYRVLEQRSVPVVVLSASRSSDCWLESWRGGALECLPWPSGEEEAREVAQGVERALGAAVELPSICGQLRPLPAARLSGAPHAKLAPQTSQTLVLLLGPRAVDGLMQSLGAWGGGAGGGPHSAIVTVELLHPVMRMVAFQALGLQGFFNHSGLLTEDGGALRSGFHLLSGRDLGVWVPSLRGQQGGGWGGAQAWWLEPLTVRLASLGLAQILMVVHGELDPQDVQAVKALQDQQVAMAQYTGHGYRFFDQADASPLVLESEALWSTVLYGGEGGARGGASGANAPLLRWMVP